MRQISRGFPAGSFLLGNGEAMSIPNFKNEAEFRTKWIAPFLSKLGYILPTHNHGTGEQGKDFFFAEHDKFGHLRFNAAQVKLGKIGSGNAELSSLLHQVRSCFDVTLNYHKGTTQQRISAVYIMTNGSISEEARRRISGHFEREHFGENVFYLDGETLDNLDRHATFIDDKNLRNRLVALLNEANFNLKTTTHIYLSACKGTPEILPCRMLAVGDALANPFPENIITNESIAIMWICLKAIDHFYSPLVTTHDPEEVQEIRGLAGSTLPKMQDFIKVISEALTKLDEQYSLEIEIVEPAEKESKD